MNIKLNFKINVHALLMLVVLAIPATSFAQKIKATAKLDSNEIQIGQQVKLELSIQYRVDN